MTAERLAIANKHAKTFGVIGIVLLPVMLMTLYGIWATNAGTLWLLAGLLTLGGSAIASLALCLAVFTRHHGGTALPLAGFICVAAGALVWLLYDLYPFGLMLSGGVVLAVALAIVLPRVLPR